MVYFIIDISSMCTPFTSFKRSRFLLTTCSEIIDNVRGISKRTTVSIVRTAVSGACENHLHKNVK